MSDMQSYVSMAVKIQTTYVVVWKAEKNIHGSPFLRLPRQTDRFREQLGIDDIFTEPHEIQVDVVTVRAATALLPS